MTDHRMATLNELVEEVTKDEFDVERVQALLAELNIPYHEDPIQLLNNILKGIHKQEPQNEPQAQ